MLNTHKFKGGYGCCFNLMATFKITDLYMNFITSGVKRDIIDIRTFKIGLLRFHCKATVKIIDLYIMVRFNLKATFKITILYMNFNIV